MALKMYEVRPRSFYENPDSAYSYRTFELVPYLIKGNSRTKSEIGENSMNEAINQLVLQLATKLAKSELESAQNEAFYQLATSSKNVNEVLEYDRHSRCWRN